MYSAESRSRRADSAEYTTNGNHPETRPQNTSAGPFSCKHLDRRSKYIYSNNFLLIPQATPWKPANEAVRSRHRSNEKQRRIRHPRPPVRYGPEDPRQPMNRPQKICGLHPRNRIYMLPLLLCHRIVAFVEVDSCGWYTKTPFASIRRIVRDERFFFKIKPGLWALKEWKERLPKELIPTEKQKTRDIEKYNHTYFQGLLVEIGNLKNHKTYVPPQDKNHIFSDDSANEIHLHPRNPLGFLRERRGHPPPDYPFGMSDLRSLGGLCRIQDREEPAVLQFQEEQITSGSWATPPRWIAYTPSATTTSRERQGPST